MVIDGALLMLGTAGSRVSFRLLRNWLTRRSPSEGSTALIYGAGDGGELLLRELRNNRSLGLHVVGFVDDDPQKSGRMIHGIPVMGSADEISRILVTTTVKVLVASTTNLEPLRWEQVRAARASRERPRPASHAHRPRTSRTRRRRSTGRTRGAVAGSHAHLARLVKRAV